MIIFRLGFLVFSFLATLILSSPCYAEQSLSMPIGQYITVKNEALLGQTDLLQQNFQVHFSPEVKSIKEAIKYLLKFSGYTLVPDNDLSPTVKTLLVQPLPAVMRRLGPLTLQEGLLTLVGKPFGLLVDPAHRLISFYLLPGYTQLYKNKYSAHSSFE